MSGIAKTALTRLSLLIAGLCLAAVPAHAAVDGPIKAGAAKIDVTPGRASLPEGTDGVHDPVFVRAIVVDNGATRAALVSVDTIGIPTDVWARVSRRIEQQLGIPARNLMLGATHTHSAFLRGAPFEDGVVRAVADATKRLQPATIAYGTGVSYINVNRNMIDPATHRWTEGPNYDGPSDKTVAVVRFSDTAGKPIAVYYNYAVHAVLSGQLDQVSADIPGATSGYIEDSLGPDTVAVWSEGAAGDQNPIYFQQTYDLREWRIRDYAKRGIDISNTMLPGGKGLNKQDPAVVRLMNQQRQMVVSMGQMLGEEVLHVVRTTPDRPFARASIEGAQSTITCPGRTRIDSGRAGSPGHYEDAGPVPIRLSMVALGDIVIGGVDAELFTTIGQRLKQESPFKRTILATLANGTAPSGYIPNDAAFGYETFEVLSSQLKPGCAETAIVDGLVALAGRPTETR
ncbi:hypothetical protein [Sphingomonas sp. MMS24-J13]|uniref:hypothetical protein n=1 Tax=Sphingomonas sp. MMS24-J13 TaxID=3238686 RepID=UPI00385159F2